MRPLLNVFLRKYSTEKCLNNFEISPLFTNRNPRNLEKLTIAYKPDGYHVEKPGRSFWHTLRLERSNRYVTATVEHFENGPVVKASTSEWVIKKQLYRPNDTSAYINLARVLADRCIKCGIIEISSFIHIPKPDGKIDLFLKTIQENGVSLNEPPQFKPDRPWDQYRKEKPWEVTE